MFRQMKIALRAGLGFGFVALLVFALGVFALTRISAMEGEAEEVDQRLLPTFSCSVRSTRVLMIRAGTLRLLISQQERAGDGLMVCAKRGAGAAGSGSADPDSEGKRCSPRSTALPV